MVLFFECHRMSVEPKSSSCLSMTGEDTGLGALASPLAGYLGKVQERAASLDHCPWCTSKGFTYALRTYRINLQESVTLCTNPQCLFPLVTRPLEDVLANLVPVVPTVGNKRRNATELEEVIQSPLKRLRTGDVGSQIGPVSSVTNGLLAVASSDGGNVNGYHKDYLAAETEGWDSQEDKEVVLDGDADGDACTDDTSHTLLASSGHSEVLLTSGGTEAVHSPNLGVNGMSAIDFSVKNVPVLNGCSRLGCNQNNYSTDVKASNLCSEQTVLTGEESLIPDIATSRNSSEDQDLCCYSLGQSDGLASVPEQLLWRNRDNLCWLDSLLAALVNCKSLRRYKPKEEPDRSSVWQLMREYEDICAAVKVHQQAEADGAVRVPSHVLQKASVDLQSLRMSVFKLLQPKLKCKLGQMETPVFAMPLLLSTDSWVEHLFQSTFQWEFKCSECKVITKERVIKTLSTFTHIVPDWRPLNAVHFAPCNMCGKKNQRRTMLLERLPPVFALHFVEGLPKSDVSISSFNFKKKHYSVTTVIQYSHQLKHFVTWVCNDDGSWLEYDDLKYPEFKTHPELPVPPHEMHVVFWEEQEDAACSPPAPEKEGSLNTALDEQLDQTHDQSFLTLHNDTDIVCALTEEDISSRIDTTDAADVDASIGDATLLETFDGLSHNDIITLTLVGVEPADSEMQLLNDSQRTRDTSPVRTEGPGPSPDSSLSAAGGDVCHGANVEPPATLGSSNTESVDSSSADATSAPGAKTGRGRSASQEKTVRRKRGKKASSEPSSPKPDGSPAQDNTPPVEVTQQLPPVSSTDKPETSHPLDQNARWSFLLSKHPLTQFHKSPIMQNSSLGTEVKSPQLMHSAPNPIERQTIPSGLPKQLITEESGGLPPKAAEMYCRFGAKSSTNNSLLPSPPQPNSNAKLFQPTASNPLLLPKVMFGTLPPIPGAKLLPEGSKKHSSSSSKVPPGLSETEALRYKLMKKLKAKKKKLQKLNQLLTNQKGGAFLQPDSTDLTSPSTVTSSTYDGSVCPDFLSDLLSPSTTASNLSPDSTEFLEMLTNGQDEAGNLNGVVNPAVAAPQSSCSTSGQENENFLEDFLMQCCGLEAS